MSDRMESQHPSHGKVVLVLWTICGGALLVTGLIKYAFDAWGM
jgi:hypothetical protein